MGEKGFKNAILSEKHEKKSGALNFLDCLRISGNIHSLANRLYGFSSKHPDCALLKHYRGVKGALGIPLALGMLAASRYNYKLGDVIVLTINGIKTPFLVADYCEEAEKHKTPRLLDLFVPRGIKIPSAGVLFSESIERIGSITLEQKMMLKQNPGAISQILQSFLSNQTELANRV